MTELFRIGTLSEITNTSVKTLRFYDEIGILKPALVDIYTGYRYYNNESIERVQIIKMLKDTGFSLNEIKDFSDEIIQNKLADMNQKLSKTKEAINILNLINKNEDKEKTMKEIRENAFVNDENMIGKWKHVGTVTKKENFKKGKLEDFYFFLKELYLAEGGAGYWIIHGWSKGYINLKDVKNKVEIEDDYLYFYVEDKYSNEAPLIQVYKRENKTRYNRYTIPATVKDDINMPFIANEEMIGAWETVDFVKNIEDFKVDVRASEDLFLKGLVFNKDGTLVNQYNGRNGKLKVESYFKWTKNFIIDDYYYTASECIIKNINGTKFMFMEWKSGDYIWGNMKPYYYVLKKI